MNLREERIRELTDLIAARLHLHRSVEVLTPDFDRPITRRYYLRRIRWLAESYGLAWQIDQATLGNRLDSLDDDELQALLGDMEQGRRCCVEGIGFDDMGLVRSFSDYAA